jgi:hypothetical protein
MCVENLYCGAGSESRAQEEQLMRFALMIRSSNLYRQEEVAMREFRWSPAGRDPKPFPRVSGVRLG